MSLFSTLLVAEIIAGPFRDGLRRMYTDFPNYYTAAILTAKHRPLRRFYDWSWFQRQIDYAGAGPQLGGYIPHTPLTMMPLLPLTGFPPLRAKQIWVALQLVLLAASVLLVAQVSRLHALEALVLVLLAHAAVGANFRLGQYYVLILFLLALAFRFLLGGREYTGGALLGVIFALKLYTAPFAFYFAARRQWKALAGFMAAIAGLGMVAVAVFGWSDVWFFVNTVMARGMDGSVNDPYNPGWASMTAFLRRTLVAEPGLNPHPAWNAPAVFFFLRAAYTLGVLAFSLVAMATCERKQEWRALAWFVIVLFVLSPNEASYHFVLLALPLAMLLHGASRFWAAGLLALYLAVELPLYRWDAGLFPKAWLMLGLFLYAGWPFLRRIRPATAGAVLVGVLAVSWIAALARMRVYRAETPQTASAAIPDRNAIYSEAPAPSAAGWTYEAIDGDRYALRRSTAGRIENFRFEGDAFHPAASPGSRRVAFELVTGRRSRICFFDAGNGALEMAIDGGLNPSEPALSPDGTKIAFVASESLYVADSGGRRLLAPGPISNPAFFPDGRRLVFAKGRPGHRSIQSIAVTGGPAQTIAGMEDCFDPAVSPDGRLLVFACSAPGGRHIRVQDFASGAVRRLTSGFCNNDSPAWAPDERSIVFASDCGRGLGLTALYRLPWPAPTTGTRK